jgi:hypothetical protein
MYGRIRENMSIIKTLIKMAMMILLLPFIVYILFHYLDKDAWFWTTMVGIGNLMLLFASPNLRIAEGIRKLGYFNWIFIWFVSLASIVFIPGDTLIIDIIRCAAIFMTFIGCSVFQIRIMDELRKTKR